LAGRGLAREIPLPAGIHSSQHLGSGSQPRPEFLSLGQREDVL
jgi:hypothetical protein